MSVLGAEEECYGLSSDVPLTVSCTHRCSFWKVIVLWVHNNISGLLCWMSIYLDSMLGDKVWSEKVGHCRHGMQGYLSVSFSSLITLFPLLCCELFLLCSASLPCQPDLEPVAYGLKPLQTISKN